MSLIHKLLDKIYFVDDVDAVSLTATRNGNGGPFISEDTIRAKDPSKVRMSRIRTEFNDVCIPYVLDPESKVKSATIYYKRTVTYFCGIKISDEPLLERILEYEDGRQETQNIEY